MKQSSWLGRGRWIEHELENRRPGFETQLCVTLANHMPSLSVTVPICRLRVRVSPPFTRYHVQLKYNNESENALWRQNATQLEIRTLIWHQGKYLFRQVRATNQGQNNPGSHKTQGLQ